MSSLKTHGDGKLHSISSRELSLVKFHLHRCRDMARSKTNAYVRDWQDGKLFVLHRIPELLSDQFHFALVDQVLDIGPSRNNNLAPLYIHFTISIPSPPMHNDRRLPTSIPCP